jgi:hypothetical protein
MRMKVRDTAVFISGTAVERAVSGFKNMND